MNIDLKQPFCLRSWQRLSPLRRRGGRAPRRGAAAVEMALVLMPYLLFIFAIFEFGRFVMVRNLVENAVREGCRLAAVNTDVNDNSQNLGTADIQQRVKNVLAGQSLSNLQIQIYLTDSNGQQVAGNWVTATYQQGIAVHVSGSYKPVLAGWVLGSSVPVQCKSVMNSEGQ